LRFEPRYYIGQIMVVEGAGWIARVISSGRYLGWPQHWLFFSARGQTQSVHSASRLVALPDPGAVAFSVRNGALRHPGGWAQALLVAVPLSLLDSGITSLIVRECRSADGFVGSTIEPEIR
jgi:hypothetical protein